MAPIDDPFDARLRASDPARRVLVSESDLNELLLRVKTPNRSRRGAVVVGAGVVAVLAVSIGAVPAAAAVVDHFFAQTGWFGDSPNPGRQSTGSVGEEYIDLLASDSRDYILTQYPSYIPTPPSQTRTPFGKTVVDRIMAAARQTSAQNGGAGVVEHAVLVQRSFAPSTADVIRTDTSPISVADAGTRSLVLIIIVDQLLRGADAGDQHRCSRRHRNWSRLRGTEVSDGVSSAAGVASIR